MGLVLEVVPHFVVGCRAGIQVQVGNALLHRRRGGAGPRLPLPVSNSPPGYGLVQVRSLGDGSAVVTTLIGPDQDVAGQFAVVPLLPRGRGIAHHHVHVPAQSLGPEIFVKLSEVGQAGQVAGFPGVDGERYLLAVGVGAVVTVGATEAHGFQQAVGHVQVKRTRLQVLAPAQGIGGDVGPAVRADRIGRVETIHNGILVDGMFGGLPDLLLVTPHRFFPAIHVRHQVVRRFPLPGDRCPVDALDVANHVDVGFNQLGVAAAQGGQATGRLGNDFDGQGVEGDATVFGETVFRRPEEIFKLFERVFLLQDEVGNPHGANADGVGLVALEPGGAGAGAHGGFGHYHGTGALGVFGPVEREVQPHGVESYLHLVIGRALGHAVDQPGQSHVARFVVAGLQQFQRLRSQT